MAHWLFQSNPDRFDVDGYLRACNPVMWLVSQHQKKVWDGDRVYLYRCKGKGRSRRVGQSDDGGVVGRARVLGVPFTTGDCSLSRPYWNDPAEAGEPRRRVWLLMEWVHDGSGPLSRSALLADPVLSGLPNLPAAQKTNFALDEHLAAALEARAAGRVMPAAFVGVGGEKAGCLSL